MEFFPSLKITLASQLAQGLVERIYYENIGDRVLYQSLTACVVEGSVIILDYNDSFLIVLNNNFVPANNTKL